MRWHTKTSSSASIRVTNPLPICYDAFTEAMLRWTNALAKTAAARIKEWCRERVNVLCVHSDIHDDCPAQA